MERLEINEVIETGEICTILVHRGSYAERIDEGYLIKRTDKGEIFCRCNLMSANSYCAYVKDEDILKRLGKYY